MMMVVSSAVSGFIERHPTIKGLALAFLVLVGAALIARVAGCRNPAGLPVFCDGLLGRCGLDRACVCGAGVNV